MSGLNLEQTGRSTEKSIREAGFDPAALLRGQIDSVPPATQPPPSSDLPAVEVLPGGRGDTNTPVIPHVGSVNTLPPRQIQIQIPEGTVDGQAYVENYVRQLLDGVHTPVSRVSRANPAEQPSQPSFDDEALLAELQAWFAWKAGGGGPEPTIPLAWRPVVQRVWLYADVNSLEFSSSNGVLGIRGLSAAEARLIYSEGSPGLPEEPGAVITLGNQGAGDIDWSFLLDDSGAVELANLPAPTGGSPMTMVAGTAVGLAARYGPRIISLVKSLGVAGAVAYIANELIGQGVPAEQANAEAMAAVEQATKKKRRRRRRMLTCSDKEDIQFLIGILGKGEMGKTAISSLLAGCRR